MKKNKLSTLEVNLLSEEMEGIDKQLAFLDPNNPEEVLYGKKLKFRQWVIAKAFQGHKWPLKKLYHKNVSGFYQ